MAKNRKDIDAFQKAMLSNTKVIGSNSVEEAQTPSKTRSRASKSTSTNAGLIPSETLKKIEVLAKELNISTNELIALALDHFLDLKAFLKN